MLEQVWGCLEGSVDALKFKRECPLYVDGLAPFEANDGLHSNEEK